MQYGIDRSRGGQQKLHNDALTPTLTTLGINSTETENLEVDRTWRWRALCHHGQQAASMRVAFVSLTTSEDNARPWVAIHSVMLRGNLRGIKIPEKRLNYCYHADVTFEEGSNTSNAISA